MKVVVIGGVAAGTKVAAKLKRENPNADIVIYTKGKDISYAGCGLPYYIGGSIETRDELIVNSPEKYSGLTSVKVVTEAEATSVNTAAKTITVNGQNVSYDKLVIATGASPIVPNVEGINLPGVFKVRTVDDAEVTRKYIDDNGCKRAVVVGGGFIGLEVAENLVAKGLNVTVVDMADQVMPNIFDKEMANYIKGKLVDKGVRIMLSNAFTGVSGDDKATGVKTNSGNIPADVVVLSIGVRPATAFLADSGIEMNRGTIVVNDKLETNVADVYAVGDCAQVFNRLTGKSQWSAMGSTANITGRILAQNLGGKDVTYHGVLGTGVVKVAEGLNAGRTGLTEKQAVEAGYDVVSAICVTDDKAHYYYDSSSFITKVIGDKTTGRLLGMQVIGSGAVDKMVDVAVTGISLKASVVDFLDMDFAYAPPFSTAIHPFAQACGILVNKMEGTFDTFTPVEYADGKAKGYTVLDAHPARTINNAKWIDVSNAAEMTADLDKEGKYLLVCAKGKRGYFLQNKMRVLGFKNTKVLEGGATFNKVKVEAPAGMKLSADEIKRVKGLGCLQDKRYNDIFNIRVITRNGRITTEESKAISEAAELFGSGLVAMTTRLTIEIQGVPYAKLDDCFAYLKERGLDTGGTGSKVRPVVSCKGTTCQYGLIDTYGLSEKLHEIYYVKWHDVILPHKFKIAVGGCPNNCVKPDLNDLGIIGQRVPVFDYSKCRGCKVCQVENACPIKVAKTVDNKLVVDESACNHCGRCKNKCPFGVTNEYQDGYKIYIAGRWGKNVAHGKPLDKIFTSEEEVIDLVERAILFFRDEGISGERFSDTVTRLGFDYVQDKLLNGEIKKDEILKKTVKAGATC